MKYRQALPVESFDGRDGKPVTLYRVECAPPGKRSVLITVPQDVHTRAAATLRDGDEVELIATAYEWDRRTKIAIQDIRKVNPQQAAD